MKVFAVRGKREKRSVIRISHRSADYMYEQNRTIGDLEYEAYTDKDINQRKQTETHKSTPNNIYNNVAD